MKKLLKLTALSLVFALVFSLAGCSTFNKVQKALEDMGYAIVESDSDAQASSVKENAEEDERVTNVHVFTNKDSLTGLENMYRTTVIVLEFKKTDDLVEYLKEDSVASAILQEILEEGTVQEIYATLEAEGLACGNCFIFPFGLDDQNVLDKIKTLN